MNKLDYYEIGKRIRKCREELGLSQEEAAERCHISPSFYSNIERGVKIMSLETFVSICQAFSVSARLSSSMKNCLKQTLSFYKRYPKQKNMEVSNIKNILVFCRHLLVSLIVSDLFKKQERIIVSIEYNNSFLFYLPNSLSATICIF